MDVQMTQAVAVGSKRFRRDDKAVEGRTLSGKGAGSTPSKASAAIEDADLLIDWSDESDTSNWRPPVLSDSDSDSDGNSGMFLQACDRSQNVVALCDAVFQTTHICSPVVMYNSLIK
jgi:hypothetical protein